MVAHTPHLHQTLQVMFVLIYISLSLTEEPHIHVITPSFTNVTTLLQLANNI